MHIKIRTLNFQFILFIFIISSVTSYITIKNYKTRSFKNIKVNLLKANYNVNTIVNKFLKILRSKMKTLYFSNVFKLVSRLKLTGIAINQKKWNEMIKKTLN